MKEIILFNIADLVDFSRHPPLGLSYIKSYAYYKLSKYKNNFRINIVRKNILEEIRKQQPLIVGISSVTQYYTLAIKIAKKIKEISPNSIILIGGVHISTLPQSFNKVFSIGIIREGEITFSEILEYALHSGLTRDNLFRIKGIIFFDGDRIQYNPERELIQNLDEIPQIDREDFDLRGTAHIISSRGCPYSCSFCSSSHFWGSRKVRYHSASYVFEEIKNLISKYDVDYITVWDDLFVFNKERLIRLAELMRSEPKIFKNISLGVNCRANIVSEELCQLMKNINVRYVHLGLESGSERILREIKGVGIQQNEQAVEILKRHGFNVQASFIIGNPGETRKDIEQTYELVKKLKLDGGCVNVAIPMPATPYWDYALKNNLVKNNMDFGKLSVRTNFQALLKEKDFILLSLDINKKDFIELGKKIEEALIFKEGKSILNIKTLLNRDNMLIAFKNPKAAAKYLFYIISNCLSLLISKSRNLFIWIKK